MSDTGWTRHEGLAHAIARENIDTDQIIPARFMSAPRSAGYGRFLLHDLRFDEDGEARSDTVLPTDSETTILVTRRNFGGGSSREAAVYALVDFGIRAVFAPSFGDIFSNNAVNNGLLPARISEADADALLAHLAAGPRSLAVDLDAETVAGEGIAVPFALDPVWRTKLTNGWDDIDLTRAHAHAIADHRATLRANTRWLWPPAEASLSPTA